MQLYLATKNGVVVAVNDAGWRVVRQGMNGRSATAIIAREKTILAGTTDGVFISTDDGASWQTRSQGLTQRHVRWLAYRPDVSDFELAGTEPAAIFVSQDGGESWQERPEVAQWREEFGWWLPYSPEAGCVRGFAFHGQRVYAAVEVGGLLRSDDGGANWQLAAGSDGRPRFGAPAADHVHPDVHSVAVHPSSPDLVFAPTGGGFYRSTDGGQTWDAPYADCYVRAVWADPADPEHLILGPAENSSGRDGRIEETHDGGETWRVVSRRWQRNMVERFAAAGETLFAVMSNGALLATDLEEIAWQPILPEISGVNAVTTMA